MLGPGRPSACRVVIAAAVSMLAVIGPVAGAFAAPEGLAAGSSAAVHGPADHARGTYGSSATPVLAVSAHLAEATVDYGRTDRLTAAVTDAGGPVQGATVAVTVCGLAHGPCAADTATTDEAGTAALALTPRMNSVVRVQATDTAGDTSNISRTGVHVRWPARVQASRLLPGPWRATKVSAQQQPLHIPSYLVTFQLGKGGGWVRPPDSQYVWATRPGTVRVRIHVAATTRYARATSPAATIRIGRTRPPRWLARLNSYRAVAGAPKVAASAYLSHADALHVRYMDHTGDYGHTEDPNSKWYTRLGANAAANSDLAEGSGALRLWASAPFHAFSMIAKDATVAGFATGGYSALWVSDGSSNRRTNGTITYPAPGRTTHLRTLGDELPDPTATCPRAWHTEMFTRAGFPVIFSNGHAPPRRVSAKLTRGGARIPVCVVTGRTYRDPGDSYAPVGRAILQGYRAIFILPERPLPKHARFHVRVRYAGRLARQWAFRTA